VNVVARGVQKALEYTLFPAQYFDVHSPFISGSCSDFSICHDTESVDSGSDVDADDNRAYDLFRNKIVNPGR